MKRLIAMSLVAMTTLFASNYQQKPIEKYVISMPKQALSRMEIKDLMHMREEEKLARDVYITLYSKWHLPVFKNISKSESWHMHMIKLLLNKYNLPDPVEKIGDKVGVFENRKLQNLYYKLVAMGEKSPVAALKVGALIEDLDIYDLNRAIRDTDNKDIKFVYSALRHGSENHMRAFVRLLRSYGSDYTPKYISKSYFDNILSSKGKAFGFNNALSEIYGKVVKVYQLPGLRKGVTWWMMDVETKNKTIRVAIAPTWILPEVAVRAGDIVEIEGYQGMYSFIVCKLEDKTSGFEYISRSKRCAK
ncbi:DUF2202 domain-containing protein [Caminibacter pacificus]|uniref:DUF2202 domain-containing protein n=1 Tax=Caminibacter pacificus TaxID=1424653 RepID=A0AAJ4UXM1_9BACT|nr:DUF2202 domain-containing protein [Caminibacter pacificus]QCI28013.1 DUF2202 domain-containing protein [Caminibacter pacificus]ROR39800.1 hypothetical protein EDC58_0775 [Caminibacter pacificus]